MGSGMGSGVPAPLLLLALSVLHPTSGTLREPLLILEGPEPGGIRLRCLSEPPLPDVRLLWSSGSGRNVSGIAEPLGNPGSSELGSLLLRPGAGNAAACRALRRGSAAESAVVIADVFFPSLSPWLPAFILLLILALCLVLAAALRLRRDHRMVAQERKSQQEISEEIEELRMELEEVTGKLQREKLEMEAKLEPIQAQLDFRRAQSHAVPLSLDELCAPPALLLRGRSRLPPAEPRARPAALAVAREGFSCGKHYWEVELGDGGDWELGVLREEIRDSLRDSRRDPTPDSLRDPTPDSLRDPTPDSLRDPTPDSLRDSLRDPAPDSLRDPTPDSLRDPTPDPLQNSILDPVPDPIPDSLQGSSRDPIPDSLRDPIPDSLRDSTPDPLRDSIPNPIPNSIPVPIPNSILVPIPNSIPDPLLDSLQDHPLPSIPDSIPNPLPVPIPDSLPDPIPNSISVPIPNSISVPIPDPIPNSIPDSLRDHSVPSILDPLPDPIPDSILDPLRDPPRDSLPSIPDPLPDPPRDSLPSIPDALPDPPQDPPVPSIPEEAAPGLRCSRGRFRLPGGRLERDAGRCRLLGVLLDQERRLLQFFDAEEKQLLGSLPLKVSGNLFPFFRPGSGGNGLGIRPVGVGN